jgi:hypothetical protein
VAVYVDELFTMESANAQAFRVGARHGHRWCHMFADTPEELHAFAPRIGMRREWADDDVDGGHYDLTPPKRAAAIKLGAIAVDTFTAVAIWNITRAFAIVEHCKAGRHTTLCLGSRVGGLGCQFATVAEVLARFGDRVPRYKVRVRS